MNQHLPLVLVPGLLNTARLWAEQEAVLGRGRRIQVVDSAASDTLGGIAEALLRSAPERFALAGLSMGGYVCFEVLRWAPLRIDRLCLVDTTARADTAEQSERRRQLMDLATRKGVQEVVPMLIGGFLAPQHHSEPHLVQVVREMADQVGADGFVRQQLAILGRPDSLPDLAEIGVPTTVIVGEHDTLTPVDRAREMAEAIPGARLVIIREAGHLAPLENPHEVTAAMQEWLS